MYIARLLYPIKVLGPNNRLGIWFSICKHGCEGCSNPELWECKEDQKVSVDELYETIIQINAYKKIDGFTITGGDPFYQSEELLLLINKLVEISDDIIVYTGFTYQELIDKKDDSIDQILSKIAVLIDGKYVKELNDNSFMVGSNNQQKIILNEKYKSVYENYFSSNKNQIQNFIMEDGVVSVGIHQKDFDEKIKKELSKKYE